MNFRMYRTAYVAAVALSLSSGIPARAADDVVATLGSEQVKASDVKSFIAGLTPEQRDEAAKNPKFMDQVVRTAIGRRVLLKAAEKDGWASKPEIAEQIERARREVILNTYLQSKSVVPASYPSEEEVRAAYDANRDRLVSPPEYHLAEILVAVPAGASSEAVATAERKARDIAKKAKARGADFADLARNFSDDKATGEKGGDLGSLPENKLLPGVLQIVRSLHEKGVSEPIRTSSGWHIVELVSVKPAAEQTLAQVHDGLVNVMRQTKANQEGQAYVDKLLTDQHLTIDDAAAKPLFTSAK